MIRDATGRTDWGCLFIAVFIAVAVAATAWGLLTPARSATCEAEPLGGQHWQWRIVDGHKCWYESRKRLPKGALHWPRVERAAVKPALVPEPAIEPPPPKLVPEVVVPPTATECIQLLERIRLQPLIDQPAQKGDRQ